jgi:3-oxoacyl-[acyl-carrier-protein] synthase III
MLFKNSIISQINYYSPTQWLTSDDIEFQLNSVYQNLRLPAGRMELQSGIKRRGFFPRNTKPSTIAANAAKPIVEKYSQDGFDLLIYAGVCRDMLEPSTATFVCSELKLSKKTIAFDLSNACLGMMNGVILASQMIEAAQIKRALIVTGENSGPLLLDTIEFLKNDSTLTRESIKKYVANFTIGSMGVALVVEKQDENLSGLLVQNSSVLNNTDYSHLCQGGGNTHNLMMETNAEELLIAGLELAQENYQDLLMQWKSIPDKIITHQVGSAHQFKLYESLLEDLKKDFSTYPLYGNTGSAAWAISLAKAIESEFIVKGDKVALLGIGSGIHSAMIGGEFR